MSIRRLFVTALLLGPLVSLPAPSAAQEERAWTVSVIGEAGLFVPLRPLGKNSQTQLALGAVVAELETAPTFGGGVVVEWPATGVSVRGRFEHVPDGDVSGRLGICGDRDQPLLEGSLCNFAEATYSMSTISADLQFLRGRPGATVRPVLSVGFGARDYDFDARGEQCTAPGTDELWQPICARTVDIWRDGGGWSPMLRFGVGLRAELGPIHMFGDLQDLWGRYGGGVELSDGNTQNDLIFNLGLTAKVF